jgi:hypothetical protein
MSFRSNGVPFTLWAESLMADEQDFGIDLFLGSDVINFQMGSIDLSRESVRAERRNIEQVIFCAIPTGAAIYIFSRLSLSFWSA